MAAWFFRAVGRVPERGAAPLSGCTPERLNEAPSSPPLASRFGRIQIRWKLVPICAAEFVGFFLVMCNQIPLRFVVESLPDVIEFLLSEKKCPLVFARVFVHLGHAQRIDRTGFHAKSAEDALRHIDIKCPREADKDAALLALGGDHLDTMRRAGGLAQIASDAALGSVVIAKQAKGAPARVRNVPLDVGILEGDFPDEHMPESQPQGAQDLAEENRVENFLKNWHRFPSPGRWIPLPPRMVQGSRCRV